MYAYAKIWPRSTPPFCTAPERFSCGSLRGFASQTHWFTFRGNSQILIRITLLKSWLGFYNFVLHMKWSFQLEQISYNSILSDDVKCCSSRSIHYDCDVLSNVSLSHYVSCTMCCAKNSSFPIRVSWRLKKRKADPFQLTCHSFS